MLHVICGAPCSGKTTYVKNHAGKNDLVIDLDKIAHAFGGSEYHASGEPFEVAMKSRAMAIDHSIHGKGEYWLIDTLPTHEHLKEYKQCGAEIIVLRTSMSECLERAKGRPQGTTEAIHSWFKRAQDLLKNYSLEGNKMSETVNQENATVETPEKTFTQAELDTIVNERLKRERAKYEGFEEMKSKAAKYDELEENSKSELQKAVERAEKLQSELDSIKRTQELQEMRERVAKEAGIPLASMSLITGETEEACQEQCKLIMSISTPGSYPKVPDGGEVQNVGNASTRALFSQFAAQSMN